MDKISALMDGELDRSLAQTVISELKQNDNLQARWETYHLIGDSLRDRYLKPVDLCKKLKARLSQEPTILAPRNLPIEKFRIAAMPIAASVAAVALVGWLAFSNSLPQREITVASNKPTPAITASISPSVISQNQKSGKSGKKIQEYLLAHQEFSPSTTIQGVAPYVQTVALESDK